MGRNAPRQRMSQVVESWTLFPGMFILKLARTVFFLSISVPLTLHAEVRTCPHPYTLDPATGVCHDCENGYNPTTGSCFARDVNSKTTIISANGCGQKIVGKDERGETGYEVVSGNPLKIRRIAPHNEFGDYENGTAVANVSKEIERWRGVISSCPEPCLGYNEKRRALIKWLECVAGNKTNSDPKSANGNNSNKQANIGNVSQASGGKSGAIGGALGQKGQVATQALSGSNAAGASSAKKAESTSQPTSGVRPQVKAKPSKYVSKEVNHCVEIIPKEFKGCKYKRCLYNACPEKISVRFKGGGSGGWGMIDLANGRSWPVNNLGDDGSYVYFQACSWDPKAGPNHGPYVTGGCRY